MRRRGSEARRSTFHYWQLSADPGFRLRRSNSAYWAASSGATNRTERERLLCAQAFVHGACPSATALSNHSASHHGTQSQGLSRLFFSSPGHLSNCKNDAELARYISQQLGKTLVMPLCLSAENTEQTCRRTSRKQDHRERVLLVNMTAVYTRRSFGRCQSSVNSSGMLEQMHAATPLYLTCVAPTAVGCAWFFAPNQQFKDFVLHRFVQFDLAWLAAAWLAHASSLLEQGPVDSRTLSWAQQLHQQDAGEPCTQPLPCERHCSPSDLNRSCRVLAPELFAKKNARKLVGSPPCLRNCQGLSAFDVAQGDVFVPNLSDYTGMINMGRVRTSPCLPLSLAPRPAAQADELLRSLPRRFLCVHWRAGNFLSPVPISRLHGKSLLSLHQALANGTVMAILASRAARAVGASHILVLSNAKLVRVEAFSRALDSHLTSSIRVCTDVPPDAEKYVCSKAAGLLLSESSSFSLDILRMAPRDTPYALVGQCPSRRMLRKSTLLSGTVIPCL